MVVFHKRMALAAGALLLAGASAQAAPATTQASAEIANRPITAVAAMTEGDDDLTNCSRTRRRLWVEGEGWIVRRVTTCR